MAGRLESAAQLPHRLSLTTKGVLVIAIPVGALIVAMAVFYQFQQQTRMAQASVVHSLEVGGEIRRVTNQMVDAETGIRGYLLTGKDAYLAMYNDARAAAPGELAALEILVAHDPAKAARLPNVRQLTTRTLGLLETLRLQARERTASTDLSTLEESKVTMDALRAELSAMSADERRVLRASTVAAGQAMQRTEIAIFAGGLLGLVGGIFAIIVFTVRIGRRVQRVEEHALAVARGVKLEGEATGVDEIAQLERTLQETSRLLSARGEELQAAQAELESRVALRTHALLQTAEELRKANEVRQALLQSAPLAIWSTDLEGKITFWNPGAERIFGWTEAEVLGKPLPTVPAEFQVEYEDWRARSLKGESLARTERPRQRKDGARLEAAIWSTPVRDATGAVSGTIGIVTDITDRKQLEAQVRQSQKLEAVGLLAGGVAHDFNNLLTVIMGYVEMLIDETREQPKLADYAQQIQSAADRAGALTGQMLAFSRRQVSQPKVVDLNDVVTHSMKLLRRVIGEDVEVSMHLDPKLGRVKADPVHIDQVVMNLALNARDAMEKGGTLTVETANVVVDGEYAGRHVGVTPGPYCMLAVSDTGIGMMPEVRNRLFEPFFTTKEAGKGTGLGLAIVYGIVKQSGGEIMVYSEPGKGTTFKVYLPITGGAAETEPVRAFADERGSGTILLCEDEQGIRKLVVHMLTRQGYRVLEAESVDDALRMVEDGDESIDLLLTDVVMPKMSGIELASAVRNRRPNLKVLYMSGYADARANGGWPLAGEPFLQKPFTAGALSQKLREVLGETRV